MGPDFFGGGGMWGFPIMPFLFVIFIVFGLFMMSRGGMMRGMHRGHGENYSNPQPGPEETALDVLKKRYAKGEITGEEFEKMKEDIK
ncbi:MAG: SHOCT domain-containing protein [Candidatus Desulfatibia sp.]|uniref:SHOCT domain-containing protein n=1 Tax=Candidatus Desulfatibia sp. TaxID=3101189 RepID=UPI002F2D59C2